VYAQQQQIDCADSDSFKGPTAMNRSILFLPISLFFTTSIIAQGPSPTLPSPFQVVELNVGESQEVTLSNGRKLTVKLLDLQEQRDNLRSAVRRAEVKVEIAGQQVSLVSANYNCLQKSATCRSIAP
jgi:hypothetical protein